MVGERRERPYINLTAETLLRRAGRQVDELEGLAGTEEYAAAVEDIHELLDETARYVRNVKRRLKKLERSHDVIHQHFEDALARAVNAEGILISLWEEGSELTPSWQCMVDSFQESRERVYEAHRALEKLAEVVGDAPGTAQRLFEVEACLQAASDAMPRAESWFYVYEDPDRPGGLIYDVSSMVHGAGVGVDPAGGDRVYGVDSRCHIQERIQAALSVTECMS